MKSRKKRWMGHVSHGGDGNTDTILAVKLEKKGT
jgi:hypothetical protein